LTTPEINGNIEFIGISVPINELKQIIRQVAPTDVTVLITGESGVGKELVAKQIHALSRRSNKPFITVNCGAIPEGIIESELFGHHKGSFTGAIESRKGYFEMADKGTIFLDEIGELPPAIQVKFLRVIEYGEFQRVGESIPQKTDVRIVAATNKDLEYQVSINEFREDLFYRLKSINIHIPPLKERKEDIKLLFDHFVKEFCSKNNIIFHGISDKAMELIVNYSWPGNIRQLKNFTESILTLCSHKMIEYDDVLKHLNIPARNEMLPAISYPRMQDEKELLFRALFELKTDIIDIKHRLDKIGDNNRQNNVNDFIINSKKLENITYDDFEQELLTYYWNKYHGNINKIAKKLKISYRTLYRKYKNYGLKNGKTE
jgi:DNA-binding NtrC family response regulator